MQLALENYEKQNKIWPESGRHILAQYDEKSIVVYQAYRPSIGEYAAKNQHFKGGGFSLDRMSWIKPNFLWMMYRCGWGVKQGQETILAIWLYREAFETILKKAVYSSFQSDIYQNNEAWTSAVKNSDVRLQWDPDHSPNGGKLERRAIQLGLKGETLKKYSNDWILRIENISEFVAGERLNLSSLPELVTPKERVLPITDPEITKKLKISNH